MIKEISVVGIGIVLIVLNALIYLGLFAAAIYIAVWILRSFGLL